MAGEGRGAGFKGAGGGEEPAVGEDEGGDEGSDEGPAAAVVVNMGGLLGRGPELEGGRAGWVAGCCGDFRVRAGS